MEDTYTWHSINNSSYILVSTFPFFWHGHWEDGNIKFHLWWTTFCRSGSRVSSRDLSYKLSTTFQHLHIFCPDGSAEISEVPLHWMQWKPEKSERHRFLRQQCCYCSLTALEAIQSTGTEAPYTYPQYGFLCHFFIACLNFLIADIPISEINQLIAATEIFLSFFFAWSLLLGAGKEQTKGGYFGNTVMCKGRAVLCSYRWYAFPLLDLYGRYVLCIDMCWSYPHTAVAIPINKVHFLTVQLFFPYL